MIGVVLFVFFVSTLLTAKPFEPFNHPAGGRHSADDAGGVGAWAGKWRGTYVSVPRDSHAYLQGAFPGAGPDAFTKNVSRLYEAAAARVRARGGSLRGRPGRVKGCSSRGSASPSRGGHRPHPLHPTLTPACLCLPAGGQRVGVCALDPSGPRPLGQGRHRQGARRAASLQPAGRCGSACWAAWPVHVLQPRPLPALHPDRRAPPPNPPLPPPAPARQDLVEAAAQLYDTCDGEMLRAQVLGGALFVHHVTDQ